MRKNDIFKVNPTVMNIGGRKVTIVFSEKPGNGAIKNAKEIMSKAFINGLLTSTKKA